jgi:hypothetical protein
VQAATRSSSFQTGKGKCRDRGTRSVRAGLALARGTRALPGSLRFSYDFLCFNEAIGIDGDGVDTAFHEESGDLGVVAGRFAADADFAIFLCAARMTS